MLPDTIGDAEAEMLDYLRRYPDVYEWLRPRINDLLQEMARVRFMLDVAEAPLESVWPHVRSIRVLLEQVPLDHEKLNNLIDPVLAMGPSKGAVKKRLVAQMRREARSKSR